MRNAAVTEAIGIPPHFHGTGIHDGWTPLLALPGVAPCALQCPLRELTWVAEHLHQLWAQALKDLPLEMRAAMASTRAASTNYPDAVLRTRLVARYHELLCQGVATNPLPPPDLPKRGRRSQPPARNLLDRLFQHRDEVLAFLDDFSAPFDNNQAERDPRMLKVQQKISGTFRSPAGAVAFCRIRGLLSTWHKHGNALLGVYRHASPTALSPC